MTDGGLVKTKICRQNMSVTQQMPSRSLMRRKLMSWYFWILPPRGNAEPDYDLIEEFASEVFLWPMAVELPRWCKPKTFCDGVEKIVLGDAALRQPALITEIADLQVALVLSCAWTVKGTFGKSKIYSYTGHTGITTDVAEMAKEFSLLKRAKLSCKLLTATEHEVDMMI